jgi:hypothetical protein
VRHCIFEAKRIVAAHAAAFLQEVTLDTVRTEERWGPYAAWYRQLEATDTIFTFNYDRVLEHLIEAHKGEVAGVSMVTSPAVLEKVKGRTGLAFKLHGSTDWKLIEGGAEGWKFSVGAADEFLRCNAATIAVATPGRGKISTARNFEGAWLHAEAALAAADQIFFVGYRFPPSDAEARLRLMKAIRASRSGNLTVVLGEQPPDRDRVAAMLKMARDVGIDAPPLRAEEFLSLWTPQWVGSRPKHKVSYP